MFGAHPMFRIGGAAGYSVPYSLRFRYSNNASLSRTGVASPTNDKVFTWSGWVKLGLAVTNSTDYGVLFNGYTANSDAGYGVITISNPIAGFPALRVGGWATNYRITTAAFRDPSAWYHIVLAIDTTNATAGDRIKIYVNGTQITSFGTSNNPSLNATMGMNNASTAQRLGLDAPAASANHFDGYMAEVNFIDGQALTPSNFGQTDATTGVWVPKKYSGTYGNNGFYLKFADASAATAAAIGKDSSGNGNNWTPSGISVTSGVTFDQMTDTPTTNFSTLNPLASHTTVGSFAAANTEWSYGAGAYYPIIVGSAAINSKTYWEVTVTAVGGASYIGIILASQQVKGTEGTNNTLSSAGCWSYGNTGTKNNNNAPGSGTAYGASYTTGDVIGVTYDPSTTTIAFYKNGVSQGSAYTNVTAGDAYAFASGISGANFAFNFGARPFSYTPPTGFKALNTQNVTSTAVTLSGSFTGNAAADGPFIWANGNPATLTINGNAVTFGTHADKTAGGFKLRTSSVSYNASGTNNWTATAGNRFVQGRKPNNAQVNP